MARTRAETEADVILNTGRADKSAYIIRQMDNALKIACTKHTFNDSLFLASDLTITEDATSIDISSLTNANGGGALGTLIDIITARIVEADGTRNLDLDLRNRQWWDKNVINPEDNFKGWPKYGLHFGDNIIIERPADDNLELRLRVQTIPTYVADGTECPIELLDTFVEQYVTALTFLSIGATEKYVSWYIMSVGRDFDKKGIAGGALKAAIDKDRSLAAERKKVERDFMVDDNFRGTSVLNNTPTAPNFGNTVSWF